HERRRMIDERECNRERLRRARVDAAVPGAAAVVCGHGDRRRSDGSRGGCVGERPVAGDGRLYREQAVVVVAGDERDRLAALVAGPGADRGRPTRRGLEPGVLRNALIAALGEGGGVVDGCDGDGEGLRRARVVAAVGGAAVVVGGDGDGGGAVSVGGGGVGERPAAAERGLLAEEAVVVVAGGEGHVLGAFGRRSGADRRRPAVDGLCARVLENRLIGALHERRRMIDERECDRERLRRARVDAAVRGAAAVVCGHGDRRRSDGSRGGCVGERPVAGDGRLYREQAVVVVAGDERDRLAALVAGPGADRGRPTRRGLEPGVLRNALIAALGEGGGVVDGCDGDGEGLRRARVVAAVGGAAVVVGGDGDGGGAVGVGGGGVGERPAAAERGLLAEEAVVVVAGGEGHVLGAVGRRSGADRRRPAVDGLCARVLENRLIGALRERRRMIDGADRDRERLRGAAVLSAAGNATVVVRDDADRRRSDRQRGDCVSERPVRVDG